MHIYMCLTSHNLSGSTYMLTPSMQVDQKVYMLTFYIATCKLQKNVINCYYGISVFAIMDTVLIPYLSIPVFPVYCPALLDDAYTYSLEISCALIKCDYYVRCNV